MNYEIMNPAKTVGVFAAAIVMLLASFARLAKAKCINAMLVVLLVVSQAKADAEETVDGVTYNYYVLYGKTHSEAVISRRSYEYGCWESAEYSAAHAQSGCGDHLKIPSTLGGYPVTRIDKYAFAGCYRWKSVTIPNSVTHIGEKAFYKCEGLTSIIISPSKRLKVESWAFDTCPYPGFSDRKLIAVCTTDLAAWCGIDFESESANPFFYGNIRFYAPDLVKNLVVPDGVEEIKPYAFCDCKDLTTVTIPTSVKRIGKCAFSRCRGLTSVIIPNSVTNIGEAAFRKSGLTSITIPSSVTSIEKSTFEYCEDLKRVTIPNSVTNIGEQAFDDCDGLNVHISDLAAWCGIMHDGYGLDKPFKRGTHLILNGKEIKDLVIPDSVKSIRSGAFNFCYLKSVTIPNSVTNIGRIGMSPFGGSVHISDLATWCRNGGAVHDDYDLYLNGELVTDLILPDSVTDIGDWAFACCRSLASVTIPNSVTNIGGAAFADCKNLKWVVIPSSVKSIGGSSFRDCSSLEAVYYLGDAPPFTSEDIYFRTPTNLVSYVKEGSTGWLFPDFPALPETWPLNGEHHSRTIKHGAPIPIKDTSNGKGKKPLKQRAKARK